MIILKTVFHQLRVCLTCGLFDAGTTGAILLFAFFMDIIVWYKAGSINFVDEQVPPQEEELNPIAEKARSETSV